MNVLVACECSGQVSRQFRLRGHKVVSCDLKESEYPRCHYQGDVKELLQMPWDLMIGHPPCTYLCNSGVRWMNSDREVLVEFARRFFLDLWYSDIPKICLENPVPHRYARLPKYSQIIHPWQFGHTEKKATCLWLKGLPDLQPVCIRKTRNDTLHRLPPGPDRSSRRSRTFTGIARAMADQWG